MFEIKGISTLKIYLLQNDTLNFIFTFRMFLVTGDNLKLYCFLLRQANLLLFTQKFMSD